MVKKVITIAVLYAFMLLLLPSALVMKGVEAAAELKEVELSNIYAVTDAVQYKEKTFFLGAPWDPNDRYITENMVSVREGNNISVIIPKSEIHEIGLNVYNPIYILGNTTNKIYISSGSDVFIVDKETNQYQKQTKAEFLGPLAQVLKQNGYTDLSRIECFFNKDELVWVTALTQDSKKCIFINKNGTSVVKEDANGAYITGKNIDKNGNLYYVDSTNHKLIMIDSKGKQVTYDIPTGLGGKLFIDQNSNIYIGKPVIPSSEVFKIENGQLKLIKTLPISADDIKKDNNGQVWYSRELNEEDLSFAFGYIDNQFNLNDVYSTVLMAPSIPGYDVYDQNIVAFTHECFGISIQSQPLKGWVQKGGKWYYHNPQTGKMQTGWLQDKSTWYYLNGNGEMQSGWQSIGGVWYYFNGSGVMQSGWQSIGGTWYHFNGNGAMQSGWQAIGGTWYYFNGSGAMQSGWQLIGGKWYYFNGSGAMQSGWQSIGGKWYYFNGSGAMQSGWQLIGGTWYYFYASGQMAANTTIGGYKLGSNGALV